MRLELEELAPYVLPNAVLPIANPSVPVIAPSQTDPTATNFPQPPTGGSSSGDPGQAQDETDRSNPVQIGNATGSTPVNK